MKLHDHLFIGFIFAIALQWAYFRAQGVILPTPWNALAPGVAIFASAYLLSWGAELIQFEIPQSLALAFLALVAVLPEYAVDMYFAWQGGKDPHYIHYATANMTGSNRLLIGVGWAAVVLTHWWKSKKLVVHLEEGNRLEISALLMATLYSFVIYWKKTLSWSDAIFFLIIFFVYLYQASSAHHEEPEIEGPIEAIAQWRRGPRLFMALLFFAVSGGTIFIAAQPFAEGLLVTGRHWGIEEFILVQWLAPLASESPEFIVAILFALKLQARASLTTLISSKVNQWTLLIGMLPLVFNWSAGHFGAMPLDARQSEELFLTSAQSLFAIVVISNLSFSVTEALLLLVLFLSQIFFTSTGTREVYAYLYLLGSLVWMISSPANRRGLGLALQRTWKRMV